MLKLLIDTSVWLDLAKDYRNLPLLTKLGALVERGDVELLVPDVVLEEFQRNRDRVLSAAKASQSDTFRRVRNAVSQFGDGEAKTATLKGLDDVNHKIAIHGEASNESLKRVEDLFASTTPIVPSVIARSRATNRGLEMQAPFVRPGRNSTADAVLIETYAEILETQTDPDDTLAFVTANTADFSNTTGDKRTPHSDLAELFDGKRSIYSIQLDSVLRNFGQDLYEEEAFNAEFFSGEPRRLSDIQDALQLLLQQMWYNHHRYLKDQIEAGEVRIVDELPKKRGYDPTIIVRSIWEGAQRSATRVEEKYPAQLGPWDDVDWGMILGKISALRWALGEEWDMLDN